MGSLIVGIIIIVISSVFALHTYKNRFRGWGLLGQRGELLYTLSSGKAFIPYGFYEKVIFLKLGCYEINEIQEYYWKKDAKEEMHLILKVIGHPIFEKGKRFIIDINIPKIDVGKVDLILEDYGIKRKDYI